jgi:ABC-type transporter MlaC component
MLRREGQALMMTVPSQSRRSRRRFGLLLAGALAAVLLPDGGKVRADSCPGEALALRAGNAFIAAARNERPADFADALARYTDMNRIALFALGRYRSALPRSRRSEFITLTERYVANTLAGFALKFRALSISPIECRGNLVITRLEFGGGRAAQRAVWRIEGGKVVDVDVQQTWLAQLLRENYVSILDDANGDFDALFAVLKKGP